MTNREDTTPASGSDLLKAVERPWGRYQNDFNAMTDAEVDYETREAQDRIDEDEAWVEAVAQWNAAGRPRSPGTGSGAEIEA